MTADDSYVSHILFFGGTFGFLVYISVSYESTAFALFGLLIFTIGLGLSSIFRKINQKRQLSPPNDSIRSHVEQISEDMDIVTPEVYQHNKTNIGFHHPQYFTNDTIVISDENDADRQKSIIAHELIHVQQSNKPHIAYLLSIPISGFFGVLLGTLNLYIGMMTPLIILIISAIVYCDILRRRELDADRRAALYVGNEIYRNFIPLHTSNRDRIFSSRPSNEERISHIKKSEES